jgi:hypothetical protein
MITFQNIGYMGRLGNQMFQFASTLGIGKRKGYDVKFPVENCNTSHMIGPIDVKTGSITPVKCDLLECFDIPKEYFIPRNLIPISYSYNEKSFEYDPFTESIPDSTTLNGYFQTEKYFMDIEDDIKKIFTFKEEFSRTGDNYIKEIGEEKEIISLHIRRGDYTLYPDHHPTCDPNYYKSSLEKIKESFVNNLKVLIFSDDKEWCLKNMGNYIGSDFIVSEIENPYVELYMMTKCNYHIIANSSFSWWGSWLSDSKLTLAPSKWFGPAINKNTKDIYPEKWSNI